MVTMENASMSFTAATPRPPVASGRDALGANCALAWSLLILGGAVLCGVPWPEPLGVGAFGLLGLDTGDRLSNHLLGLMLALPSVFAITRPFAFSVAMTPAAVTTVWTFAGIEYRRFDVPTAHACFDIVRLPSRPLVLWVIYPRRLCEVAPVDEAEEPSPLIGDPDTVGEMQRRLRTERDRLLATEHC